MARIRPIRRIPNESANTTNSISLSPEMWEQIAEEMKRVGTKNRSEMIRMILEQYFEQPLEDSRV